MRSTSPSGIFGNGPPPTVSTVAGEIQAAWQREVWYVDVDPTEGKEEVDFDHQHAPGHAPISRLESMRQA